jgi:hypothetical protein
MLFGKHSAIANHAAQINNPAPASLASKKPQYLMSNWTPLLAYRFPASDG